MRISRLLLSFSSPRRSRPRSPFRLQDACLCFLRCRGTAVARADYIYIVQYASPQNAATSTVCSGPNAFAAYYDGCIDVSAVFAQPAGTTFAEIVCGATSTSPATWDVYTDANRASCKSPRADNIPYNASSGFIGGWGGQGMYTSLTHCVAGANAKTPAASITCQKGTYAPPFSAEGTASTTKYQIANCPSADEVTQGAIRHIVSSSTAPLDECFVSGISSAPYLMASCSKDAGVSVKSVRFSSAFRHISRTLFSYRPYPPLSTLTRIVQATLGVRSLLMPSAHLLAAPLDLGCQPSAVVTAHRQRPPPSAQFSSLRLQPWPLHGNTPRLLF